MEQLGLFAKFWQPGKVKTRLASDLNDGAAALLYQLFLSHLLQRLKNAGQRRVIVFSPAENAPEFVRVAGEAWQTVPQAEGGLGERMSCFFKQSFLTRDDNGQGEKSGDKLPFSKTVVIGSDCLQLSEADIREAFLKLDDQPVVLGPSTDGGYYLLGMRNECVNIFEGIDWSTDRVFDQTVQQLDRQSIGYSCLPPKTDIDELDSLLAFQADLKRSCSPGDPEFVLLHAVSGILSASREPQP